MKTPKKPDWQRLHFLKGKGAVYPIDSHAEIVLDNWWSLNIQPWIDEIEKGTVVFSLDASDRKYGWYDEREHLYEQYTHQALLINIEPIEKDSPNKLLRDIFNTWKLPPNLPENKTAMEFYERAKRLLEGGGDDK